MPDHAQRIIPMLSYEDGYQALEWLCAVFGFTEQARWIDNGILSHGEIVMGEDMVMLAQPTPDYRNPNHPR